MGSRSDGKTLRSLRGIPSGGASDLRRTVASLTPDYCFGTSFGTGWLTAAATNAATACASLPWTRLAAIAPLPCARPFSIAFSTRLYGGRRSSRFGPTVAAVPAAASVWQFLHCAAPPNRSRPCCWSGVRLLTLAEGIESRWLTVATTAAGTPIPSTSSASTKPRPPMRRLRRLLCPRAAEPRAPPRSATRSRPTPSRTQKSTKASAAIGAQTLAVSTAATRCRGVGARRCGEAASRRRGVGTRRCGEAAPRRTGDPPPRRRHGPARAASPAPPRREALHRRSHAAEVRRRVLGRLAARARGRQGRPTLRAAPRAALRRGGDSRPRGERDDLGGRSVGHVERAQGVHHDVDR